MQGSSGWRNNNDHIITITITITSEVVPSLAVPAPEVVLFQICMYINLCFTFAVGGDHACHACIMGRRNGMCACVACHVTDVMHHVVRIQRA